MKNKITLEKTTLHSRNLHKLRYDFELLIHNYPNLKDFVFINEFQIETIDFSNPNAVKALNKSLLFTYYNIKYWDIPNDYLCPPIPGRADYIHNIADLLASTNNEIIPLEENVIGLDIGVGANCIYPILGNAIYGWSFVGTDIDANALENCVKIVEENPHLSDAISFQLQPSSRFIFKDIILPEDKFAFTLCNPPFHSSEDEATKATIRKVNNLEDTRTTNPILNFGGQNAELWCDGGELAFITQTLVKCEFLETKVVNHNTCNGYFALS